PIANLARFRALAHGITISSTLDQLVAAEETGALVPETGQAPRLRRAPADQARAPRSQARGRREAGQPDRPRRAATTRAPRPPRGVPHDRPRPEAPRRLRA